MTEIAQLVAIPSHPAQFGLSSTIISDYRYITLRSISTEFPQLQSETSHDSATKRK